MAASVGLLLPTLAACMMVVLPVTEGARAFFVFGDSLVDNGNNNYLATTARADSPPYGIDYPTHQPTGRFSNGLNIPDIITPLLLQTAPSHYASASAAVRLSPQCRLMAAIFPRFPFLVRVEAAAPQKPVAPQVFISLFLQSSLSSSISLSPANEFAAMSGGILLPCCLSHFASTYQSLRDFILCLTQRHRPPSKLLRSSCKILASFLVIVSNDIKSVGYVLKIVDNTQGERLGAESTLPYLSPELRGQRLLVGANFASAGIGILNDTGIQFANIIRISQQLQYFEQYQQRVSSLIGNAQARRLVNGALILITLGGNDFVNNYYLVPFSARSREFALPDYVRYVVSEYKKILSYWVWGGLHLEFMLAFSLLPSSSYCIEASHLANHPKNKGPSLSPHCSLLLRRASP
ncbi:GDSL esterase/lipase [Apostasia shenzhenica]|uniref:GDSL esterase/lipase n=1 Tax=Apostasia shenzhenica TaxID=1088818 RepID=A0A2I0AJP0_9ASPA|nr:GDSL esterase/lipase [Apostasia shenzhenica]